MDRKYLTIEQAAEYLGYSVNGIRYLVKVKKIPFNKPNGKIIFIREELDNWVKGNNVPEVPNGKSTD